VQEEDWTMNKLLTGFCALALGASVLAGCTESGSDRVGERPGDRTPSASPPSTTTTPPARTPSDTTTTPGTTGSPSTTPGAPSGTGTR
jgi:hypothetical protein